MAGPLIVTAELGAAEFAWLDRLRRAHYPPERNHVPAHLTIFRALPPSAEVELRSRLARINRRCPPPARIEGLMDLGGGVAFRIVSTELDAIRSELATALHGLLSAQDSGGWRPHVTIQNKVAPKVARAALTALEKDFRPRAVTIHALGLYAYLGGPWERIGVHPFRG
jgi:hypothetical protein